MKTSSHISESSYHTWRDIGGPAGLVLDLLVFVGILIAAAFMMVVGTGLLLLDGVASPVLSLFARLRSARR